MEFCLSFSATGVMFLHQRYSTTELEVEKGSIAKKRIGIIFAAILQLSTKGGKLAAFVSFYPRSG